MWPNIFFGLTVEQRVGLRDSYPTRVTDKVEDAVALADQ